MKSGWKPIFKGDFKILRNPIWLWDQYCSLGTWKVHAINDPQVPSFDVGFLPFVYEESSNWLDECSRSNGLHDISSIYSNEISLIIRERVAWSAGDLNPRLSFIYLKRKRARGWKKDEGICSRVSFTYLVGNPEKIDLHSRHLISWPSQKVTEGIH